jgi:Fe2+ or Zn2+ uptake regulation protein
MLARQKLNALVLCPHSAKIRSRNITNIFEDKLRASGQSVTAARKAVYAALQDQEPLTMRELVECVQTVDKASVYRTISLFEKLGIVQRLQTGWKYKLELTDDFHEHHHHATCLICEKSFVLPEDESLESEVRKLVNGLGFTIKSHQLEIQGNCTNCAL